MTSPRTHHILQQHDRDTARIEKAICVIARALKKLDEQQNGELMNYADTSVLEEFLRYEKETDQ